MDPKERDRLDKLKARAKFERDVAESHEAVNESLEVIRKVPENTLGRITPPKK